jgi:hypothetical protein
MCQMTEVQPSSGMTAALPMKRLMQSCTNVAQQVCSSPQCSSSHSRRTEPRVHSLSHMSKTHQVPCNGLPHAFDRHHHQ